MIAGRSDRFCAKAIAAEPATSGSCTDRFRALGAGLAIGRPWRLHCARRKGWCGVTWKGCCRTPQERGRRWSHCGAIEQAVYGAVHRGGDSWGSHAGEIQVGALVLLVHGDGKHLGLAHEQGEEADQEDYGACYCHDDRPDGHVAPGDVKGVPCHLPHFVAIEVVTACREAEHRLHDPCRRGWHEHGVGKWLPGA
jgi:hypothetical protein